MIAVGTRVQVRIDFLNGSQWELGKVVGHLRDGRVLVKVAGRSPLVTTTPEACRVVEEAEAVSEHGIVEIPSGDSPGCLCGDCLDWKNCALCGGRGEGCVDCVGEGGHWFCPSDPARTPLAWPAVEARP